MRLAVDIDKLRTYFYAKEDFDSDDLEKKRAVVVKLGEKLEVLDRVIQFRPNKYFVPLEEMNKKEKQQAPETVRTGSQQGKPALKTL